MCYNGNFNVLFNSEQFWAESEIFWDHADDGDLLEWLAPRREKENEMDAMETPAKVMFRGNRNSQYRYRVMKREKAKYGKTKADRRQGRKDYRDLCREMHEFRVYNAGDKKSRKAKEQFASALGDEWDVTRGQANNIAATEVVAEDFVESRKAELKAVQEEIRKVNLKWSDLLGQMMALEDELAELAPGWKEWESYKAKEERR